MTATRCVIQSDSEWLIPVAESESQNKRPRVFRPGPFVLPGQAVAALVVLVGAVALGACGSGGQGADPSRPAVSPAEFPQPKGETALGFAEQVGRTQDLVASPAGQAYEVGSNRFAFGVFNPDATEIDDADVAIYAAPGPTGKARGPFPARIESLETKPAFASETSYSEEVSVVYVTELRFDRPGEWRLVAVVRQDDRVVASLMPSIEVGRYPAIPDVGEKPPRIHTPTAEDVGDLSEIETRVPPDTMHTEDLYDVLERDRAAVLVFATPALCMSRVCGPVVDIAEQAHQEASDDVGFIHVEVYRDNDPAQGFRTELEAFGLQTEPWLFVIDRSGRVSARIEGAFSADELTAAIEVAQRG